MKSRCLGLMMVVCMLGPLSFLAAQENSEKAIKYPVEMKPFSLKLVDEMGQPVADASVIAYGVRCEESPGSWIGWPESNAGNNKFTSDATGTVEMKYPVKLGLPGLWMTVNKIDFNVKHPDFVTGRVEFDPELGKAEHTLIKGCRTVFSCVDDNGNAIQKFGAIVAGAGSQAVWKLDEGELRSSGLPDGSWQTMFVAPGADGVTLFSGVLPARYAKGKDVIIRNAKLRPGMRLSGALSENVPRPVIDGKVIAWCVPKPTERTFGNQAPSISWWEETTVAEDGSFEFPSLPRGGTVQLIAISNGWLTAGKEGNFTVDANIDVSEQELSDNLVSDIVLEMTATGSVEVEVLGPDGKPLAGATVSTWPNQKLHLGGTTLVGACYRTMERIDAQITGDVREPAFGAQKQSRYEGKTDEHGKVTLRDIPMNQNESLYVGFDGMRMKHEADKPKDIFADSVNYLCDTSEPKKVTVHMQVTSE